jgi:hypothetical protein
MALPRNAAARDVAALIRETAPSASIDVAGELVFVGGGELESLDECVERLLAAGFEGSRWSDKLGDGKIRARNMTNGRCTVMFVAFG